jgi:hypothetical protein
MKQPRDRVAQAGIPYEERVAALWRACSFLFMYRASRPAYPGLTPPSILHAESTLLRTRGI